MVYTPEHPPVPDSDALRARIPGWGADLDKADRPSFGREGPDVAATGAHWTEPEQQPETRPRERSIEHARLTPVFGTSTPLRGLSGVIRRYAYRSFSEGRAAHWLLLIAADRVDAVESHVESFWSGSPDNPITQTGVGSEFTHHGYRSRAGSTRVDKNHAWIDPLLVAGPWLLTAAVSLGAIRWIARRTR